MVRHKDRKYQTFCPEHGWGVSIDEDGCCGGCGCVADGSGIDEVAAELTRLRALVDKADELARAANIQFQPLYSQWRNLQIKRSAYEQAKNERIRALEDQDEND